ncbi:DNA helicase [Nocardiopsis sp. CC223A]|uniref:DNA helicase n=1 Tax=Nocardiopsis sp. CC223A TaxID=3044051 RepID=UPI00278C6AB2|nr:DNA helicase [Nocardiopsis sp. CC223A]
MRSLRDDEQEIGDLGTPVSAGRRPAVIRIGRQGAGGASLRWKPPAAEAIDPRALLGYLRACLRREAVHTHTVLLGHLDGDTCACLPGGTEPLFTGGDRAPVGPAAARVVRLAARHGQALRYGYPLVILGEGADRAALPLLTVDVQAVEDPAFPDAPRLRAIGPPDVNAALLERLGATDPEDLFELRTRLRSGPQGPHLDGRVADLAVKVRTLLSRLEIERVDDIDPAATRDAPRDPVDGAHNVAVLFRAGPGARPGGEVPEPGTVEAVLADLDPTEQDGIDPGAIGDTALQALLRGPGGAGPDPAPARGARAGDEHDGDPVPLSAFPLDQARYAALCAAMTDGLTAVAAPPGTGVHDLVDAVVRTAVGAGQRVLVCGRTEHDVREVLRRAEGGHPVMRVGGKEHRAAEARLIGRLLAEHGGAPPRAEDPAAHRAELARHWSVVRAVWDEMDGMAAGGYELAHLALERELGIADGWDPDRLFTPERGGPEYWLPRAERAFAGGLGAFQHRSAIRRELGLGTDPETLARLCATARLESRWRAALDRRTRHAPLGELTERLREAQERHRGIGARCLAVAVEPRLWRGRPALENRLETLNWHHGPGWPGMDGLIEVLPAWACRTDQVRALPSRAGLFDLVVVLGAERTRVCELLPALHRANRALVVGDPAHPGPASALEPDEERRALAAAGLAADRLDERGLRHGTGSALRAAARAVDEPLWLDEHSGAPPLLAETASRHCYGGRVAVSTAPDPGGGPAFEWRDVAGVCEAAPGLSYINREEAYRAAVVVDEIDEHLPRGRTIAVVAPTQPQVALLRRLLRPRTFRHRVVVGGPDLLGGDLDHTDITVLSPLLARGAPAIIERRVRRMGHLWSAVLTRTGQRLVVVGDRSHWEAGDGPLAELVAVPENAPDGACRALVDRLREAGTRVRLQQTVEGWTADLVVRFGARRLLILLDREPDGRRLRRLMARGDALNRITGDPVVVVPAWRCLADPDRLVREILGAR